MMHGISHLNFNDFFIFRTTTYNLRGNSHKIDTLQTHNSCQWSNTFFARVVKYWNLLPDFIASSINLAIFKRSLNKFDLSLMCHDFAK